MASRQDLYSVLGVSSSASANEIKKAYRRIALDTHPDRHPDDRNAEDRFKEISAAYAVLGDAVARVAYDHQHQGHPDKPRRQPSPPRPTVSWCRRCQTHVVSQSGDTCSICKAEETAFRAAQEQNYRTRQQHLEGIYGHLGFYDQHGLPRYAIPTEPSARRACGLKTWKVAWVP